jgi:MFS family permease
MGTRRHDVQNLGLASLGAVLEYFDFQVYVFVAAAISVAFFPPGSSPWVAQLQAFGIYAVGYLVRPVAGITIAHFADRIGRKRLFVFTVLLMSVPTFLMGLLPTYAMVGWLAPALLLLLRVLQGCAVGGELPGAAVFVSEHAPARRLGLSSGTFQGVTNCGLLLGAGAAALASLIASFDPALSSLAWRLPFILGGLFGLLAAYLRRHLQETPMFEKMKRERGISTQVPLAVIIQQYRKQCIFALALVFVFSSTSGVYFQYLPVFLVGQLHFDRSVVFTANIVGVIAFVLGMPLWGALRDWIGWAATIASGAMLSAAICVRRSACGSSIISRHWGLRT